MNMTPTTDISSTVTSLAFNATLEILGNITTEASSNNVSDVTTRAPVRRQGGPPPPGYYGDMTERLWTILPPIIIAIGTIGNLLTLLVLKHQRKMSSTSLYLFTLALSDLVILYCGPLRNWINYIWKIDVRTLSEGGCKAQLYFTYVSVHFSSWLLVAVTWERTISVLLPHKVRLQCTRRNACLIIATILVVVVGVDMFIPITVSLNGYKGIKCGTKTQAYTEFRDDVFEWIDLAMSFAAPFTLLLIGNILIIVQLVRARANQRQMASSQKGREGGSNDTRTISILMVSLCVVYLLTMAPVSILQVYYPYRFADILALYKIDPIAAWYDFKYLRFEHAVCNLVSYTNAAFNFLLYVFSGSKFRSELKAVLCCRTWSHDGAFGSRTTQTTRTTSSQAKQTSRVYTVDKATNSRQNEATSETSNTLIEDSNGTKM